MGIGPGRASHLADRSAVPEETVKPASPSKVPWKELEPEELDFLQAIVEARFDWQEVLDGSELDDLSLTRKAVKLHKKGVLVFDE